MRVAFVFSVVFVPCICAAGLEGDLAREVNSRVGALCESVKTDIHPTDLIDPPDGLNLYETQFFRSLQEVVTNDWELTLRALQTISTNEVHRRLVLAAGRPYSEGEYLFRMGIASELVQSNELPLACLKYYKRRSMAFAPRITSVFVCRYEDPVVSNLIMRLDAQGLFSGGVNTIFSGESKELYLDAVHEGLVGD